MDLTLATGLMGGDFMESLRIFVMGLCGLVSTVVCFVIYLLLRRKKRKAWLVWIVLLVIYLHIAVYLVSTL
jgi:heme/copper-type cytochrome/quinol oxidase subunit 4